MAELFEKFEVNRETRWVTLSRLVGASLILHGVFLWMAIYVPALRDTFNIAALVANTRFVDKAYDATQIGEEVRLVQLGEKVRYPDGYFAPERQSETAGKPASDPFAPRIISQA